MIVQRSRILSSKVLGGAILRFALAITTAVTIDIDIDIDIDMNIDIMSSNLINKA